MRDDPGGVPDADDRNAMWHEDTFDYLCGMVGETKAGQLVQRFRADLAARFTSSDRETIRRDSHSVTATAGMLGFLRLSEIAHKLELACDAHDPVEPLLTSLLQARQATLALIPIG